MKELTIFVISFAIGYGGMWALLICREIFRQRQWDAYWEKLRQERKKEFDDAFPLGITDLAAFREWAGKQPGIYQFPKRESV